MMKDKIIELRKKLPIPITEAKQLLLDNDGDIETCIYLYTAKAIRLISEATNCDSKKAEIRYKAEKFDINRAISAINDEIYDQKYVAIEGVNIDSLQLIKDWLYVVEADNFSVSLSYRQLDKVIEVMLLMPKLKATAELLQKVKETYNEIFEGYSDSLPLEEYVRRNRKLDDIPDFQLANEQIPLQVISMRGEISKHWRNV